MALVQVGIVRYRSRRDFMHFALSDAMRAHVHLKWESLEANATVPSVGLLVLGDLRASIGLIFLLLIVGFWRRLGVQNSAPLASSSKLRAE